MSRVASDDSGSVTQPKKLCNRHGGIEDQRRSLSFQTSQYLVVKIFYILKNIRAHNFRGAEYLARKNDLQLCCHHSCNISKPFYSSVVIVTLSFQLDGVSAAATALNGLSYAWLGWATSLSLFQVNPRRVLKYSWWKKKGSAAFQGMPPPLPHCEAEAE